MPRNAEVIRQWEILRALEGSRRGETIHELARARGVSTRTIRRDLEALQQAGFPLYDDDEEAGGKRWKLSAKPFHALAETGLALSELLALYFGRAMLESLSVAPFQDDLRTAFAKLAGVLTPGMRRFVDRVPAVFAAKPGAAIRRPSSASARVVSVLLDCLLHQRRARMRYHSFSSRRTKDYVVEPYRLVHAPGGLYLSAFVPDYGALRTFAVERVEQISPLEETFERHAELMAADLFSSSLGVGSGEPEPIEVRFSPAVSPFVKERDWHPSQRMIEQEDASLLVQLDVSNDAALRAWLLSFGGHVRVLRPRHLVEAIAADIERARAQYR